MTNPITFVIGWYFMRREERRREAAYRKEVHAMARTFRNLGADIRKRAAEAEAFRQTPEGQRQEKRAEGLRAREERFRNLGGYREFKARRPVDEANS